MKTLGLLAADAYLKDPQIRATLARWYEVHDLSDWKSYDPATLLARCRGVEVVVTGRSSPKLPAELVADRGNLRYLLHLHGTIRHLADKALLEAGLVVTNWGDNVSGVAEGAMALLLCMLKQVPALDRHCQVGPDERICQAFPCTLKGRDVGLYGFGPIGRHMARMLAPFAAKVAIYDPYAKDVPADIRRCATLRELFATCQVISLHCGLNDATRDSVTGELLDLLPQGAVVINTARGEIVDEAALGARVKAGKLLAGVDVIRDEKKWDWPGSPLAGHRGAVLTRHAIGGGKGYPPGAEPPPRLPDHAVENLEAYAAGRPLKNVITAADYDLKT